MKKYLLAFLFLFAPAAAHAVNCALTSGASQATIAAAFAARTTNSCTGTTGGSAVSFGAGSYTLTAPITIGCSSTAGGMYGPTMAYPGAGPYSSNPYAVTINGSMGSNKSMFTVNSCSTAFTVNYLGFNGGNPQPDGGGAFYFSASGVSNFNASFNYFWGNQGNTTTVDCCNSDSFFWLDGAQNDQTTIDSNDTFQWNQFGATNDCSNIMHTWNYQGVYSSGGGYCAAFGIHLNAANLTITNNDIYYQEQGLKFYCSSCSPAPAHQYYQDGTIVSNNDFSHIHRIGLELQQRQGSITCSPQTTSGGSSNCNAIQMANDSFHDQQDPCFGSFGWSLPADDGYATNVSNTVLIANSFNPATCAGTNDYIPSGIEWWGMGSVTHGLIQGYWASGIEWGYGYFGTLPPGPISNTIFNIVAQAPGSGPPGGNAQNNQCITQEESNQPLSPTLTSNTNASGTTGHCTAFGSATVTSTAPTLSPTSGTPPLSVTVTDAGNTGAAGPLGNTGIWCTGDGSSPVPGSGTALYYSTGSVIPVTVAGSLKCVGMWGSQNQPTSYPSGWGFVPSAVVTGSYSGGSGVATPTFSPTSQTFSGTLSVTVTDSTSGSTIFCTQDGSTPTTGSPQYTGPFSLTGTVIIQCIAHTTGGNSGIGTGTYTLTVPTLTSGALSNSGNINTLAVGAQAIQFTAIGNYSDTSQHNLPDAFGNTAVWSSSNSAILNVGSTGVVSCAAVGTANVMVTAQPTGIAFNVWGMTCTSSGGSGGTTWNVTTSSNLQSVINGASAGDTVNFAAGTYGIAAALTLKCGITYTGPVVTPATAILNATFTRESASIFNFSAGSAFANPCTTPTTIQYFNFENAGGINVQTSYTNLTIQFNQFTNIPCCNGGAPDTAISFNGGSASSNTAQNLTNTTIQWNTIGDSTSCTTPTNGMTFVGAPPDIGGNCGGIATQSTVGFGTNGTSTWGMKILNNKFFHVGEAVYWGCPAPPGTNPTPCEPSNSGGSGYEAAGSGVETRYVTATGNDFNQIHAAAWEQQPQVTQGIVFQYNSEHDWVSPYYHSYGQSMACCAGEGSVPALAPYLNDSNNVVIFNTAPGVTYAYGSEAWGLNATYNNNLYQGLNGTSHQTAALAWGYGVASTISNNTICGTAFNQPYIVQEFPNSGPSSPNITGNITGAAPCSAVTSVVPTISPASGVQTYPLTVTLTDAGYTSGAQPLGNHSIWYTTDGSTPVPGSGTAKQALSGSTISLLGPASVKAVGMWGTGANAVSYPSGYGFVPSAMVSVSYTSSTPSCTTLNAGATQAQIVSALSSCSNGTVFFNAGTYGPITSIVTIPCGVSLSGPTVPYSQTPNQTATINGATTTTNWGFQTTAGCSQPQTIQYLAWNGMQPSGGSGNGGGGGLRVVAGTTNLTIQRNWWHGASANGGTIGQNSYSSQIYLDGGSSSATTNNVAIQYNIFGSTSLSDCLNAINDTTVTVVNGQSHQLENDSAGLCNGVGIHNNVTNVSVNNNIFHWLEQGMKTYEGQGMCNPLNVNYNDFSHISRIMYETQCNIGTAAQPTLMFIDYNSWHDRLQKLQTYNISAANGCGPDESHCATHTDYNVYTSFQGGSVSDVGVEVWGGVGTTGNYNYFQGNSLFAFAFDWSQDGNFTFSNNVFNMANESNTNCQANGGPWQFEQSNTGFLPVCNNNTYGGGGNGTIASVTPVISPAGGTYSTTQTVTFTNGAAATNRDANTTIWYTIDGSTPIPGTGTATPIQSGGSISVAASQTVKAIGMWGAINQPYAYLNSSTAVAYVPSSVVTNAYVISSNGVAAPTFSPASESFTGSVSVTVSDSTSGSTIFCTQDGSTPTTSSPQYTAPISVTASKTIQCIAHTTAGNGPIGSATYTQNQVATPTLTPGSQTFSIGSVSVTLADSTPSSTIHYTTDGSTPTTSSPTYSTAISVSATTTINVIAVATGFAQSAMATATYTLGTAPTIISGHEAQASNINTLAVNATAVQFTAVANYSNSTSGNLPDGFGNTAIWASSNTSILNVSSTGLVYCVSTGTANIQVTASPSNVVFNVWTMTCTTAIAAPTLSGGFLSNAGNINTMGVGVPAIQFTAYGTYSDSVTRSLPDQYGNTANWTSSNSAVLTVTSAGLVSCAAAGTANVQVTSSPGNVHFSIWTMTCSATSLQSITIACLQTSFTVGQNNTCSATCNYANGISDNCTNPDAFGNDALFSSSIASIGTITSSGIFTSVGVGTTAITATAGALTSNSVPLVGIAPSLFGHTVGLKTAWVR